MSKFFIPLDCYWYLTLYSRIVLTLKIKWTNNITRKMISIFITVPKWNKRLNKPLRDLSDGWESEGEIEDPKKVKPVKEEEDDTQEGKQEDDVDDEAAKKAQPSREALGAGDHSQTDGK